MDKLNNNYSGFIFNIIQFFRKDPKAYILESFFNNFLNEARGKAEKKLNLVKFKPKNKKGKGKELFCTYCKTNTYFAKDCWHLHPNLAPDFWDPKKGQKGRRIYAKKQ